MANCLTSNERPSACTLSTHMFEFMQYFARGGPGRYGFEVSERNGLKEGLMSM